MASHVVVIDSAARRHNVKTMPNRTLSEVLEEVCSKLNLNISQYGLKHNNKPLDLSRTFRLSGLTSGAKLELIQISKSAGVVSVALQLPESEAQGAPNARLTDKFPSTTTLWLVLRKFEAGVAGNVGASRNLTAKGAPSTNAGAGRLYYQQPVVQLMGRELASFTDLQKSLAQLGFNSGSTLLRLTFRPSETPLEEALTQIQGYFDSVDSQMPSPLAQQAVPATLTSATATDVVMSDGPSVEVAQRDVSDAPSATPDAHAMIANTDMFVTPEVQPTSSGRPVSVFAPPTKSVPVASTTSHNDSDYTPTIEHAQIHQKLLQQNSQNRRLPTDAEIAAQAQLDQEKWAAVADVEIKVRFPDQSSVSTKFGREDTAGGLYDFVRGCLDERWREEGFILRNPGVRGKGEIIPDDSKKLLIKNLQMKGRVLVVFGWDEQTSSTAARSAREVLKMDLRSKAKELEAPKIAGLDGPEEKGIKVNIGKDESASGGAEEGGKKKLPKWLKGLGKK